MGLTYVSSAFAAAASVALPTFAAGDLAVAFAYRNGSTTVPSACAGWTDVATAGGANTNSRRIAYRVLQAGDTTCGSFANATAVEVIVLRGQRTDTPIGGLGTGGSNTTTMTTPACTLTDTWGGSWIILFGGSKGTTANAKTVSGATFRSGSVGALGLHTVENRSTNWGATAYSSAVDVSGNRMDSVEIRAANYPQTLSPTAIDTDEVFGATILASPFPQTLDASGNGIVSTEVIGTVGLYTTIDLELETGGIGLDLEDGSSPLELEPDLIPASPQTIDATGQGIASDEAIGTSTISLIPVAQNLTDVGNIASAEVVGVHQFNLGLTVTGIATAEAFGAQQLNLSLTAAGIPG